MTTNNKRPAMQDAIDFFYEPSQWCIVNKTSKLDLIALNDIWSISQYEFDENGEIVKIESEYTRTPFRKEHFTTVPELLKMLYGDRS